MKRHLQAIIIVLLLFSSVSTAHAEFASDLIDLIGKVNTTCNIIIMYCLFMITVVFGYLAYTIYQHKKENEDEEAFEDEIDGDR